MSFSETKRLYVYGTQLPYGTLIPLFYSEGQSSSRISHCWRASLTALPLESLPPTWLTVAFTLETLHLTGIIVAPGTPRQGCVQMIRTEPKCLPSTYFAWGNLQGMCPRTVYYYCYNIIYRPWQRYAYLRYFPIHILYNVFSNTVLGA